MPISEHKEQSLLVAWCFRHADEFAGLDAIYAIPNGGNRDAVTGAMLKREGMRKGIPDLHLPVSRGDYNGLYIEMKRRKGGVVSPEQRAWKKRLESLGHRVVVARGFAEARLAILEYYNAE